MMSPLAVAQYVPKGSIQFDLCIIDEASQMFPESAIGALLRCGQRVVVGDTNQLPPSSFFKTLIDDEEARATMQPSPSMAGTTWRWNNRLRHTTS
jgi:superfamily I DNA and/or RNA helicase